MTKIELLKHQITEAITAADPEEWDDLAQLFRDAIEVIECKQLEDEEEEEGDEEEE